MSSPPAHRWTAAPTVAATRAEAPPDRSRMRRADLRAALGAVVLAAGGLLLVASELAAGSGIRLALGAGLSLVAAGWVDRQRVLYLQMGFPILGFGLGAYAADQVPVFAASVEPFVLGGLGAGLIAADLVSGERTPWGASAVLVLAALGTVIVVATGSGSGAFAEAAPPVAWWGFAVAQAAMGFALAVGALAGWTVPPAAGRPTPAVRDLTPVRSRLRTVIAGGVLVVGGLVTATVDLSRDSLIEVLPALGLVYLASGRIGGREHHVDSGSALLALGLALKLDGIGALSTYFEALVLGCVGGALLLLQARRPGPHHGLGRSLLTVGAVFAAIEVLPEHIAAPGLWSAAYSGWLFALLVAASGVWQVVHVGADAGKTRGGAMRM